MHTHLLGTAPAASLWRSHSSRHQRGHPWICMQGQLLMGLVMMQLPSSLSKQPSRGHP